MACSCMARFLVVATALTALPCALPAQTDADASPQAAPVVRQASIYGDPQDRGASGAYRRPLTAEPILGVRVVSDAPVAVVNRSDDELELRVDRGRANITVDHPAAGTLMLVDLPGGQVDLLADGFYTFNADTNVVRAVRGEAALFAPGAGPDAKGSPLQQGEQAELRGRMRATPADETTLLADEIRDNGRGPAERPGQRYDHGYGYGYGGESTYLGYGYPYTYGAWPAYGYYSYAYPAYGYAGWGWPGYAWDYPWGWGVGLGFYEPFYGSRGYYGRDYYGRGYNGGYGYRPWAGGGQRSFNGPGRNGWGFHPGTVGSGSVGGGSAYGGGSRPGYGTGGSSGGGFHPGFSGGPRGGMSSGGGGFRGGMSGGGFHGGTSSGGGGFHGGTSGAGGGFHGGTSGGGGGFHGGG